VGVPNAVCSLEEVIALLDLSNAARFLRHDGCRLDCSEHHHSRDCGSKRSKLRRMASRRPPIFASMRHFNGFTPPQKAFPSYP
jgi:hypothetical protein